MIGAGEKGAPVHLYGQEKIMAEKLMSTEAFNIIASDQISMHRTVPGNFLACCNIEIDTECRKILRPVSVSITSYYFLSRDVN